MDNNKWKFIFVRGPRTAATLKLSPDKAICDSAILLREIVDLPVAEAGIDVAFMPHFQTLPLGNWKKVCQLAGVTLIDPTDAPEKVISQIRGARLIITEAMHGAIVADALRTPWIVVKPFAKKHHAKWYDWAESLDLRLNWTTLWPSSIRELILALAGTGATRLLRYRWLDSPPVSLVFAAIPRISAWKLKKVARSASGQLSDEAALASATLRARIALNDFIASRSAKNCNHPA